MADEQPPALTPNDLAGFEVRLNEPGGQHWEGVIDEQGRFRATDGSALPAPGKYELSFRKKGATAWGNAAELPELEVE